MLRAVGCVITLLATVVVIACEDGSSSSASPASPSSLPFALSSQNASGELPFELNGDDRRVTLCHVTGNGSYQLLEEDENAAPAHEGHGDGYPARAEVPAESSLVAGEVPGEELAMFDEQCRIMRASVGIEKSTNDEDADEAPGPEIEANATVTWKYVVTNTGDFALTITDFLVEDFDLAVDVILDCTSVMTPLMLAEGDSVECTATGNADPAIEQYANIGTVRVTADVDSDSAVFEFPVMMTDSDPSHYHLPFDDEEPEEDEGPKVDLCHKTGNNGRYILINVSRSAEPAHLAHGDGYPGSGMFGADCSVS